jgi:hypothetical protein
VSLFPLTRASVVIRGKTVTLREWTPAERNRFSELRRESPEQAVYFMASTCLVEPATTAEEISAWPAAVLDALVTAIMALNDPGEGDAKND